MHINKNVISIKGKEYRKNVAAIPLSFRYPALCEFFLAERSDMKGVWQFPQGGIDNNESPKEALYRELKEEIGTDDIEIIAEAPMWIKYDFPENVLEKMKPFNGQIQKYFLVRLKSDFININTECPEFSNYEFVDFKSIMQKSNKFKRSIYRQVLQYFQKEDYI